MLAAQVSCPQAKLEVPHDPMRILKVKEQSRKYAEQAA